MIGGGGPAGSPKPQRSACDPTSIASSHTASSTTAPSQVIVDIFNPGRSDLLLRLNSTDNWRANAPMPAKTAPMPAEPARERAFLADDVDAAAD